MSHLKISIILSLRKQDKQECLSSDVIKFVPRNGNNTSYFKYLKYLTALFYNDKFTAFNFSGVFVFYRE